MCNSSDLSAECANPYETRRIPKRLLLYDKHPGGIGTTSQFWILVEAIPFRKDRYLVGPDNKINATVKRLEAVSLSTEFYLCYSDRELLTAALELVSTCCCLSVAGCPNCIQASHDFLHCNALHLVVVTPQELALQALLCDEYNEVLDKKAAVITLKHYLRRRYAQGVTESEGANFKSWKESSVRCE